MFYIFHGEDDFSAKEKLAQLRKSLGDDPAMVNLNLTEIDGKSTTIGEIVNAASALPFLSPKRLVVVTNFLGRFGRSKSDAEQMEKLISALKALPETTELVFWDTTTLKKNHPVLKFGMMHKSCVHYFGAPQKQNLPRWIDARVKQKGARIEPRAVQALATVVGDDLRALDNEIEKLALYVGDARPISLADVELLCPYTADSETFAMANAIGRRNVRAALDQLHKRLEEGQNPLAILAGITTQFRGLLEVKEMAASGLTPMQIAREKGWRSDFAARKRLEEARNFSTERLLQIFSILRDADLAIKTGEIEPVLALDILVSRLCGVR